MHAPARFSALIRQYGIRRCLFRFRHDLKRTTGLLKRKFPPWRWEKRPLGSWLKDAVPADPAGYRSFRESCRARFFFPAGRPAAPPQEWLSAARADAELLLDGKIRFFSALVGRIGFPEVEWFTNPFTGQHDPPQRHWCDLADFDPARGDIKYFWEPSRFGWSYALARAYAAGRDEHYPEAFWTVLESWLAANPPQMGVNWQCGQEIAFRLLACVFALHAFWASPHTTAERLARLVVLLGASAERIAGNIDYARAQVGNHATTEAAGLYTVGVLFPELAGAEGWRRLGRNVLEAEARHNNWPDGSYTQHSVNYQRLMMHAYLWCLRLGELNGESFSDRTRQRLERSYEFLYQLQDAPTGRLPNYGPNDGAMLLPLNGCDYLDYRPLLGAMHYLFRRQRLYDDGPWEEDLLWLFGPSALEAPMRPIARESRNFCYGGYYTLRGRRSWAMTRCHSYRSRPNQADMLHLDLWFRGVNLLRDSGSYSYYDPQGGWNLYFLSTAAHNTIELGRENQMIKGPRFRWFSLLESRWTGRARHNQIELWQGEHCGFRRLPSRATHRRAICRLGDDCWLIVDDILGKGTEQARLFWHLADLPCRLEGPSVRLEIGEERASLVVAGGPAEMSLRLERGTDGEERMGWQSLYYGQRTPAPTLCAAMEGPLPLRFLTLLSLGGPAEILECTVASALSWREEGGAEARVELFAPGQDERVVRRVRFGPAEDWLVAYPLPRE